MNKIITHTTLAVLLSLTGCSASGPLKSAFRDMDTNADGTISKSEFTRSVTDPNGPVSAEPADFEEFDKDDDGQITREEWATAWQIK